MLVHLVSAVEELEEVALADGDGERYADGRPDRVATPDPVPHGEAVLGMYPEFIHGAGVDRHGREMPRHCLLAQLAREPGARRARVGQRLECGEGLGGDDEECGARIGVAQHVREVHAVDVGNELAAWRAKSEGGERLHRHGRT